MSSGNSVMLAAKTARKDEFYTRREYIERELSHYGHLLRGKSIICPCDGTHSEFIRYFLSRFTELCLTRLTSVFRSPDGIGGTITEWYSQNGKLISHQTPIGSLNLPSCDMFSPSVRLLILNHDVVVTNPPFSRMRDFVRMMTELEKDFIIIGNTNSINDAEFFPHILSGHIRPGVTSFNTGMRFNVPDDSERFHSILGGKKIVRVPGTCWWTTLHPVLPPQLELTKTYTPEEYPRYDNYDAIEVSDYRKIPKDYSGVMGVPITFIGHWRPDQFELLGISTDRRDGSDWVVSGTPTFIDTKHPAYTGMVLNGKAKYARLFIRNITEK